MFSQWDMMDMYNLKRKGSEKHVWRGEQTLGYELNVFPEG